MTGRKPENLRSYLAVVYPALMLVVFFIVPFAIMVTISFFHRDPGAFYTPVFDIANYQNLFSALFVRVLIFSLFIAGLAAAVCVGLGFPFTYFITRMPRRFQVFWLVFLLSVLSLSEVIVGFAWSLMLSRTAGLSNLLVWLGLMNKPVSWTPSFAALLCGLCYLAFPYTVLALPAVVPAQSQPAGSRPDAGRFSPADFFHRCGGCPA